MVCGQRFREGWTERWATMFMQTDRRGSSHHQILLVWSIGTQRKVYCSQQVPQWKHIQPPSSTSLRIQQQQSMANRSKNFCSPGSLKYSVATTTSSSHECPHHSLMILTTLSYCRCFLPLRYHMVGKRLTSEAYKVRKSNGHKILSILLTVRNNKFVFHVIQVF